LKLSPESKAKLEEDIKFIVDEVQENTGYCGCMEGDLSNSFPKAKEDTAKLIIKLLEAWSLI